MGPVTVTLKRLGYKTATLIPTGGLAFLPLHAAWRPSRDGTPRYALDDVAFAYAPSARALTYVHQTAATIPGNSLLAVENPDGSLRYAAQEVKAVAHHFRHQRVVRHSLATRNAISKHLPQHDVYHFACHGRNDWRNPLTSSLQMANKEAITVRDLLGVPRGRQGHLAFLSACETGLVGAGLPDEAIGWASAFLEQRTAGVVSTLWSVDDRSTAELAQRFYRNWKGRKMQMDPLQALVAAQRWLRDEANNGSWNIPITGPVLSSQEFSPFDALSLLSPLNVSLVSVASVFQFFA